MVTELNQLIKYYVEIDESIYQLGLWSPSFSTNIVTVHARGNNSPDFTRRIVDKEHPIYRPANYILCTECFDVREDMIIRGES